MNLSENKRGPQMRWSAQSSPWPLPAFASCGDSCRARRPEPLGQRNNCLVFSPKMKIATSSWPGVHRAGGGSCPGAMAGAWACGRCCGTSGQSEPQGRAPGPIPGPEPSGDWLRQSLRGGCSPQLPSHVSLSLISGYVSTSSHPLGACTSTRTYLPTLSLGFFFFFAYHSAPRAFKRPSSSCVLGSSATWWHRANIRILRPE